MILDWYWYKIFLWGIENFIFPNLGMIVFDISSINFYFITWFIFAVYTILFAYFFRFVWNIFWFKWYNLSDNTKYFSFCFMLIPILNFLYCALLWFSNQNISKQIKYIIFWTIFWNIILFLHYSEIETITIFYFFPLIILFLLFIPKKSKKLILLRSYSIATLILLLIIQPFFTSIFLNETNKMWWSICYPREQIKTIHKDYIKWSKCFKIFEWINLFPWMNKK